ncbi:hypothetical protein M011DRAFT_474903 [Sporormia fimetaria CBS 119925]|uniref:Potassium channel tetramerisation-type BTB domain-containing protein n=1 Tax=Sporormia fimetaria CBS 119925 TaxID=1340428 RepID=A0A6A6VLN8_9PLEO|nr:hypothetical protein M011DRAFT_474903 [Sporormia fimetaria CBS 119925]
MSTIPNTQSFQHPIEQSFTETEPEMDLDGQPINQPFTAMNQQPLNPTAPPAPTSEPITLNVNGTLFHTTTSTLRYSPRLASIFTPGAPWRSELRNGQYIIDADPAVFSHILQFMRRPTHYPVFWSKDKGFDYNLYTLVQAEAEYFQLNDLRRWIFNGSYERCIETAFLVPVREPIKTDHLRFLQLKNYSKEGDVKVEHHVVVSKLEVFACPRNVQEHMVQRGESLKCTANCYKKDLVPGKYVTKELQEVVTFMTKTEFNVGRATVRGREGWSQEITGEGEE